ncbi:M15 family metallopeptidase [Microbacterium pumilum]|uniref:D-alanyl-D-alanine carboxypeptidase-like core domain-containing protein n=1 Tax=Microbacterium pumilum TaxID=344165 RepID=A0ABN2T052_9MICO
MQHPAPSRTLVRPLSRARRLTVLALAVCVAALSAAFVIVVVNATFASAIAPFAPTADDGLIAEGAVVTLADDDVPAVARLDAALRDAMRQAEAAAAVDGVAFQVTSGWRSSQYQQWLLDDAIELYESEQVARQFVATPERSSHVTGHAVDIAPVDAQLWLIQNGASFGICQTYANERWHFERATAPGGVCPEMRTDAAA